MPKATKDGTSFWEDTINILQNEVRDIRQFVIAQEAPRPYGSEVVPLKEQAMAHSLMDGGQLYQFLKEQNASLPSAVKYVQRMRKASETSWP